MTIGGKSVPVYVVTDAQIAAGEFTVEAGPAIVVSALDIADRGVMGGNAMPVYPVDATYVNTHGVRGGLQGTPVVDATLFREVGDLQRAVPVYVTYGSLGSAPTPSTPGLCDKLVAWYSFQNNIEDSTGSHNLSVVGTGQSYVSGKIGTAFDGVTTGHLANSDAAFASGGKSIFICGWMYSVAGNSWRVSRYGNPFDPAANRDYSFELGNFGGTWYGGFFVNTIWFESGDPGWAALASELAVGEWQFIAGWYDHENGQIGIRVNDVTSTKNVTPLSGAISTTPSFTINAYDHSFNNYGRGSCDYDQIAVAVDYVPTTEDLDWFFNSTNGRTYAEFLAQYC